MARGRPEEWRVDSDCPVRKHVLHIDTRGRITIGLGLIDGLGRELLGVLALPGVIRLLPWIPHGERIKKHSAALAKRSADNEEALQELHSIYERVTVDAQGRFALPPGSRLHLGVDEGRVIVWRLTKSIELWSPAYRNAMLTETSGELDDP